MSKRTTTLWKGPLPYPPTQVIELMTAKINAARVPWGITGTITADTVAEVFETRARTAS